MYKVSCFYQQVHNFLLCHHTIYWRALPLHLGRLIIILSSCGWIWTSIKGHLPLLAFKCKFVQHQPWKINSQHPVSLQVHLNLLLRIFTVVTLKMTQILRVSYILLIQRNSVQRRSKSRPLSGKRSYNLKWEKQFTWLEYSEDHQGAFCKICKKRGVTLERMELGLLNPLTTGRKPLRKWRHTHSLKFIFSHVLQK